MEDLIYSLIYIAFFGTIIGSIAFAIVKAIRNPSVAKQAQADYAKYNNEHLDNMYEHDFELSLALSGVPSKYGDLSGKRHH